MIKLGVLATAAVTAVGMCSLATDASAARGGGAHFGGSATHMSGTAHFGGAPGVAHFGAPRVAGNVGGWNGYRGYANRGYGFRRYVYGDSYAWGGGVGYPAYASCYVWTPLGYVNQCGYDYNYSW